MERRMALNVRHRNAAASKKTPSAPNAAASEGVAMPPSINATMTTITPTMGTISRSTSMSLVNSGVGSTS